jgi:hypothetical protein
MRVFIIVLLMLCSWNLRAQVVDGGDRSFDAAQPLGARLGSVIDAGEREYFNLFPDIGAFSSAEFLPHAKYIELLVRDSAKGDRRILLEEKEAAFLRTYLENFEAITYRRGGSDTEALLEHIEDPGLLRVLPKLLDIGFLALCRRPAWTSERVTLILADSHSVEYALLAADEGGVYVWKGEPHHHPDTIAIRLRRVPYDTLMGLHYRAPAGFFHAFAVPFVLTTGMVQKFLSSEREDADVPDKAAEEILHDTFVSAMMALPLALTLGALGENTRLPATVQFSSDPEKRRDAVREFLGEIRTVPVPQPVSERLRALEAAHFRPSGVSDTLNDSASGSGSAHSPLWAGGEYVLSVYGTKAQLYNTGIGLTFAREYPLLRNAEGETLLALRGRVAGGLTYLSGELLASLPFGKEMSILAGCTWMRSEHRLDLHPVWLYDGSAATKWREIAVPPVKALQETSWTLAAAYDHEALHAEVQYRVLIQPALVRFSSHSYREGTQWRQTAKSEMKSDPTVSLLLGFRI